MNKLGKILTQGIFYFVMGVLALAAASIVCYGIYYVFLGANYVYNNFHDTLRALGIICFIIAIGYGFDKLIMPIAKQVFKFK